MSFTDPALGQPYRFSAKPPVAIHKLLVSPSPADPRDYLSALPTDVQHPPAFVLPTCYDPLDQSQLGSCTANGDAGMYATALMLAGKPPVLISRLALYYAERLTEGSVDEDSGAVPRDGFAAMVVGVGKESLWPYDIARFKEPPPLAEIQDGHNQRIAAYYRLSGLVSVKDALFHGHPVGMAMLVYIGMEQSANGVIPMPSVGEQPLGGHWVYLRGWQDDDSWPGGGYLIVRNSWGATAGNGHGDYLLPYAYAGNSALVSEFWYITLPDDTPPPVAKPRRWHWQWPHGWVYNSAQYGLVRI